MPLPYGGFTKHRPRHGTERPSSASVSSILAFIRARLRSVAPHSDYGNLLALATDAALLLSLVPAGAAKFRVNVAWHALISAHIVRAEFKPVILTDSHPSRRFRPQVLCLQRDHSQRYFRRRRVCLSERFRLRAELSLPSRFAFAATRRRYR